MSKTIFETIWSRIVAHQGETFYTRRGLELTYQVKGNGFYPNRTKYRISKGDFEKAYQLVPIDGPGNISRKVRGSSYIWAVLHDARILLGER